MRFLLVDDSSTMRKIQRRTIEKLGYTDILEAPDGQKAIEAISEHSPDVVITDWNMPNMNGLDLVKTIRTQNKELPIIMITTEAEKCKVIEAIQAGVNDFLIKPFEPEALTAKIKKVTGQ